MEVLKGLGKRRRRGKLARPALPALGCILGKVFTTLAFNASLSPYIVSTGVLTFTWNLLAANLLRSIVLHILDRRV